jgi:hypothetical protein
MRSVSVAHKATATGSGMKSQIFKLSVSLTGTESCFKGGLFIGEEEPGGRG